MAPGCQTEGKPKQTCCPYRSGWDLEDHGSGSLVGVAMVAQRYQQQFSVCCQRSQGDLGFLASALKTSWCLVSRRGEGSSLLNWLGSKPLLLAKVVWLRAHHYGGVRDDHRVCSLVFPLSTRLLPLRLCTVGVRFNMSSKKFNSAKRIFMHDGAGVSIESRF